MGLAKPQSQPLYTVAEYLSFERESEERHEYLDGVIYAMAGESGEHGDISMNLSVLLGSQLRGKDCRARSKDTKVRSGPLPKLKYSAKGLYSYPDVVVICGEPEYLDDYRDVIANPKVIIEVLSPATEKFDRGEKFDRYDAWNPTLTDYLLVSQEQARIEHYVRQEDGTWTRAVSRGLRSKVVIKSIRCTLKLKDVYDRINLKPDLQVVK
jgi:Uma2 family endonuclease